MISILWQLLDSQEKTSEQSGGLSDISDESDDDAGPFNRSKRRRLDNATLQTLLNVPDVNVSLFNTAIFVSLTVQF